MDERKKKNLKLHVSLTSQDDKEEEQELLHSPKTPGGAKSPSVSCRSSPSHQYVQKPRSNQSSIYSTSPSGTSGVTSPHVIALQQLFHHVPSTGSQERPSSQSSSQQNIGSVSNINEEKDHDNISQKSSVSLFNFADHFDDVQRTVISIGEISVDTQDSRIYHDAPFAGGNLKFGSKSPEEKIELKKHYVCIPWDTSPYDLSYYMEKYWNMRSPKIVLSLISGVRHFKAWKNSHLKDQFKKGIIKAANTTEMWIITNGIDDGISGMIGEAVREERNLRANSRINLSQIRPDFVKKFQKLTVIGVVPKPKIVYENLLDGSEGVTVNNEGYKHGSDLHELNPDHTHFILVETESGDRERNQYIDFRSNIEKQLQCQLGKPRRFKRLLSFDSDKNDSEIADTSSQTIPVVGLLIQGSPRDIDLVLFYLRNKMPVVVVKGTGGCADLLAYALEESQERSDPDYEEHHLKPELLKLIAHTYPDDFKEHNFARNAFRDKILECVALASDDDRTFLTLINTQGWDASLADLDKHLLKALFKSERKSSSRWREEKAYKDLLLLLDWNRPDLAKSEIFQSRDFSRIKMIYVLKLALATIF